MQTENYYDDLDREITKSIKIASCKAYRIFLKTKSLFIIDLYGLGIEETMIHSEIKMNIKKVRDNFLKEGSDEYNLLYDIFDTHTDSSDYKNFILKVFNLLVISTYMNIKYSKKKDLQKIDRKKFINNIALMIIEGSHLGRSDSDFRPYFSREDRVSEKDKAYKPAHHNISNRSIKHTIYHDDFYFAQNSYLQHLLLMLVKLHKQWGILPSFKYSKISQQNIIDNSYLEHVKDDDPIPSDVLNHQVWSASLINVIIHFEEIMNQFKNKLRHSHNFIIANIRFTENFIRYFDYQDLLNHYNVDEERADINLPSDIAIRETIALIMEQQLKVITSKDKVWKDVIVFMKSFDTPVNNRKNIMIDIDNGMLIKIRNKAGKDFSINISKEDIDITVPVSENKNIVTRRERIRFFTIKEFDSNTVKMNLFEESYCFGN